VLLQAPSSGEDSDSDGGKETFGVGGHPGAGAARNASRAAKRAGAVLHSSAVVDTFSMLSAAVDVFGRLVAMGVGAQPVHLSTMLRATSEAVRDFALSETAAAGIGEANALVPEAPPPALPLPPAKRKSEIARLGLPLPPPQPTPTALAQGHERAASLAKRNECWSVLLSNLHAATQAYFLLYAQLDAVQLPLSPLERANALGPGAGGGGGALAVADRIAERTKAAAAERTKQTRLRSGHFEDTSATLRAALGGACDYVAVRRVLWTLWPVAEGHLFLPLPSHPAGGAAPFARALRRTLRGWRRGGRYGRRYAGSAYSIDAGALRVLECSLLRAALLAFDRALLDGGPLRALGQDDAQFAEAALTQLCYVFSRRVRADDLDAARVRPRALVQLLNKPTNALVRLYGDWELMAEMGGKALTRGVRRVDIGKVLMRRDDAEARAWAAAHLSELGRSNTAPAQSLQMLASLARSGVSGVASGVGSGGYSVFQYAAAGASGVASGASSVFAQGTAGMRSTASPSLAVPAGGGGA